MDERMMDMENYDPAMAKRVWQRVQGKTPQPCDGPSLQALMEDAWEDANVYRQLSRRHRGRIAALFGQLHRQTMEHLRLLKGICSLSDQCAPVFSPTPRRQETEAVLLRRCYGRALQRLNWYGANDADPRYGHILASLIRQTQQHTRLLLQLMSRPGVK